MKPFKFFGDKIEFTETIPAPVEVTINRAIITSRVTTFVEFRYDRMVRQPERQYTYSGNTSFTRDNIHYHCVRTLNDVLGRHFDNYILLHDARDVEELEYIVTYLQNHGATEMF